MMIVFPKHRERVCARIARVRSTNRVSSTASQQSADGGDGKEIHERVHMRNVDAVVRSSW